MTLLGHHRHRLSLDAYVDGELDLRGAAAVAAHVDECWGCSGELQWRRLIKASTQGIGGRRADELALARLRRWGRGLTS
jgi:anti-sigma factor RsiW